MRVVTTSTEKQLKEHGQRWLDSRKNWPKGTEFYWYTEGYEVPYQPDELQMIEQFGAGDTNGFVERKDFESIRPFVEWKAKLGHYISPGWQWNVVGFAHKVFAAADAFYDYDGVGVWLDSDCVTYKKIPKGLIEKQVKDSFIACYQRTGMYTETGLWIMDCSHPKKKDFFDYWRGLYYSGRFRELLQWHDCMTFDLTCRVFSDQIKVHNLSGEFSKHMHPQAMSELGRFVDHCKGPRKKAGKSPENRYHA